MRQNLRHPRAADGGYVNFAKETIQVPLKSRLIDKLVISRAILDADLIINVPKFKTHMQTRVTGAVKNMFGILVGAEKAESTFPSPGRKIFRRLWWTFTRSGSPT